MRFLAGFNDRVFFLDDLWLTSLTLKLFTDAAGKKGYGSVFGRKCFMVHSLSHAAEFFSYRDGHYIAYWGAENIQ